MMPANKQRMMTQFEGKKAGACYIVSGMPPVEGGEEMEALIPVSEALFYHTSPVLAALFEQDTNTNSVTIVIPDFPHKTVSSAIRFCQTLTLADDDDAASLLEFADRYKEFSTVALTARCLA